MPSWLTYVALGLAVGAADTLLAERLSLRSFPKWVRVLRAIVVGLVWGSVQHAVPAPEGSSWIVAGLVYMLSLWLGGGLAGQLFGGTIVESASDAGAPAPLDPKPIVPR